MTRVAWEQCEVAVVGAGPAGMAAAACAAQQGADVLLVDARADLGGQIWRGRPPARARHWGARVREAGVRHYAPFEVVDAARKPKGGFRLYCQGLGDCAARGEASIIEAQRLILATGATERALPFPGAQAPQVSGVGGLQALLKAGLDLRGKRVGVMGSGPLLWAVAATLTQQGAQVPVLVEQAPANEIARVSRAALLRPSLWRQGAWLRWQTRRTRVRLGAWPLAVEQLAPAPGGAPQIRVRVQDDQRRHEEFVLDRLACAFGLVPETRLAQRLGATLHELASYERGVAIDADQQSEVPGLYAVGECTGVAGVDLALAEGAVAGSHAAGATKAAARHAAKCGKHARWAAVLRTAFELRPELRGALVEAPNAEAIICPCEGVTTEQLCQLRDRADLDDDWDWEHNPNSARRAKLLTRVGMGACQGRVCGPALDVLLDWPSARGRGHRAPLVPVRLGTLAALWADAPN